MVAAAEFMTGPLPPPHLLRGYEEIVPGSANRIIEMAERQSKHGPELERTIVRSDSVRGHLGLAGGFVLSATVIGGGIYLIASGHDWAEATLIGLNLVGLAGVFVYGSTVSRDEKDGSERQDSEPRA